MKKGICSDKEAHWWRLFRFFLGAFFSGLLALPATQANELPPVVAGLDAAAIDQLAASNAWRALLHVPKDARQSLIDDPGYFLDPNGATDHRAELLATLRAFMHQPISNDSDAAPACRFVARYRWLQSQWPDAKRTLPDLVCPAWDALRARVKPHAATLVFPDGHLNSPASMFGHTLLRLDQPSGNALLSYAVNYAAQTKEDNGFVYAYKGIFGHYQGMYSLLPYAEKLKEYQHGEQRDIWEYALHLNPTEVDRLLAHVWELQNVYAYYYFFNKNCAYQLMALIEVARPELDLMSGLGASVLPIDTIRKLRKNHLIGAVSHRSSQASRLKQMQKHLPVAEIQTVKALASADVSVGSVALPQDLSVKQQVLDTAAEYLQYRRARQEVDVSEFQPRYRQILQERSLLGVRPEVQTDQQAAVLLNEPTTGHGTKRLGLNHQWQRGRSSVSLKFRAAYHAWQDRSNGYLPGAGIAFFDTAVQSDAHKTRLEKLDVVQIESLSPLSALLQSMSWRVNFGLQRSKPLDINSPLQLGLSAGAGVAYAWDKPSTLIFATLESKLSTRERLHGFFADLGWRVGGQWHVNDQLSLTVTANDWFGLSEQSNQDKLLQLDAAWYLTPNQAAHLYHKRAWRDSAKQGAPIWGVSFDWFY